MVHLIYVAIANIKINKEVLLIKYTGFQQKQTNEMIRKSKEKNFEM